MRKFLLACTAGCLLCSGCHAFEYLAPHQLWKLNRQPAMGGEDALFSLPAEPAPGSRPEISSDSQD